MYETNHYIKTTFKKTKAEDFVLFLRCIKGIKTLETPLFILPTCEYKSVIKYTRHNMRMEFEFDTSQHTGFLEVLYTIPFRTSGKTIINEGNSTIAYDTNCGFKKTFKLILDVTHIFPETESIRSFKSKHIRNTLKHITTLYLNSEFSDQAFLFNDSVFLVHKIILAAQSSVFEKMFNYDETNPRESTIIPLRNDNLPYYTFKTFTQMLYYLYTNEIEDLNKASELIFLADMFQVMSLVEMCKNIFIENISKENVAGIIDIATKLHLEDLLTYCQDFNASNISSTSTSITSSTSSDTFV